ncbi:PVC-type heme-binding CxxCH protein [Congregicoccus parvus]|uniref:PVC-type heme-binding CxxCH protein n=1 Tax=Congregicoccus parvus TaxID=3081749 RepID=UPI003FA5BFC3
MHLALRFVLVAFVSFIAFLRTEAAAPVVMPTDDARRLEVLFLGAPTANGPFHDPITRYRVLKKALGVEGINLTYSESLEEALRSDFLRQFDAVLFYANWNRIAPEQEKALYDYIAEGHGFLPIHCASACFGHSADFIRLVGARFQRHGGEVFSPVNVAPDHPILQGLESFEAWDETYVHDRHNEDRTVLQVRRDANGDEPWSWVRTHGNGRIFYTASGHDHRVWDLPAFQALLRNAVYWTVGDAAMAKLTRLQLPELPQKDVLLPDYRRRKAITRAQVALSPADSAKLIQVPPGFKAALFASEPDIVNPIFVAWDHRGRAYVIETIDYPNNIQEGNLGNDRIKICEDTDGDGRADKFTVFADKLSVPTSLVFVDGGVVATNGTELVFLQDTDGDDVADVRRTLVTGFSMRDTHAGPSNLRYGFDNWIYATIGYSGFEGTVGGRPLEFTQGLFRFTRDAQTIEYLQPTTNNTWGLGFTEQFDILGSTANGNPSWVFTLPRERYDAFGLNQPRTPRADDNPFFYPSSMDIRQVDVHDKYTAAAGHAFYTARRFPEDYHNRVAFVTEPTGKLVGTFDVEPDGASFKARQRPNNIFNSADAWTSPVAAEVGPDGALWICDWYNLIVQHNPTPSAASSGVDAETGKGNAYETALRDKSYGRIWRVYPKGSADEPAPRLDPKNADTLLAALDNTNLLWRLHAQRLLVEGGHHTSESTLRTHLAAEGPAALHAFHTLVGLDRLGAEDVAAALASSRFDIRRAAYEVASRSHPEMLARHFLGTTTPYPPADGNREWLELFGAVSRLPSSPEIGRRLFLLAAMHEAAFTADPSLGSGWQLAARAHPDGVIQDALAANLPLERLDQSLAGNALQLVAWVADQSPRQRTALLQLAGRHDNAFARYIGSSLATSAVAESRTVQFAPDPEVHARGARIYTNTCVACHGIDGKGVPDVFPPLAGSEWVTGAPEIPVRIVLHGLIGPITVAGKQYNSVMPPLPNLSHAEIADVVTYVRQSFGNDASPVTTADVVATRRASGWQREMWKAEELMPTQE